MKDKKNIDRLFQEKFRDYEETPSEQVWINIEEALREKKKRRIIPIWFKLAGVAALFLIGLLVFNLTQNSGSDIKVADQPSTPNVASDTVKILDPQPQDPSELIQIESQVVAVPESDINGESSADHEPEKAESPTRSNKLKSNRKHIITNQLPASAKSDDAIAVSKVITPSNPERNGGHTNPNNPASVQNLSDNKQQIANLPSSNTENATVPPIVDDKQKISTQENIIRIAEATMTDDLKTDSTAIAVVPNALEELLKEKEKDVTKELKMNRWQISTAIAPVYPGSASNGSPLDSRFQQNSKEFRTSLSYGIGVSYAINNRFALRTGISNVSLEYRTKNIVFSQNPNARRLENVDANTRGALVQIDNQPATADVTLNRSVSQFSGNLTQTTGYIEVPVELSYKILDKQFGIDVIGGFSTLFLNQNEVSIETDGAVINIGEANNLSGTHFSTNIGIGLTYSLFRNVELSVDPMFKYQLNTYSENSGNFKPYFFGIYSGLTYKF